MTCRKPSHLVPAVVGSDQPSPPSTQIDLDLCVAEPFETLRNSQPFVGVASKDVIIGAIGLLAELVGKHRAAFQRP